MGGGSKLEKLVYPMIPNPGVAAIIRRQLEAERVRQILRAKEKQEGARG
jgi:hypothetical protein